MQTTQTLTDTQINQLAEIVYDEYADTLNRNSSTEHIALLLEDVAGLERLCESSLQTTINAIRSKYYECCRNRTSETKERSAGK